MALFKIFNNFNNPSKTIDDITNHNTGFCYFDASTNKFYVDTTDTSAGVRQLNGTFYGECSTVGATAIKTATITGFSLVKGISVLIKFTYENSAAVADLKLNISNTGNIPIKRYGTTNLNAVGAICAGMICQFVYDGTNWIWVGQMNTDTDTKVSQSLVSTNTDRPILLAYPDVNTTTTTVSNIAYRSNNIKANPSTGTITATNFVGKVNGHVLEQDITSNMVLTDTTYTAGGGLDLEGTEFVNTGVRAIGTGTENGTISVNTAGVSGNVAVKGLKSLAFIDKAPGNNTTVFLNGAGEWTSVATTDTKNTAGASDTSSKIYLVGATAQTAEAQTYSHDTVYINTDGTLYSGGKKVLTDHQSLTAYAKIASPTFTGTPKSVTPSTTSDGTMIATKEYVDNSFTANDAMVFKGLIGGLNNPQDLPNPHKQGWTYKVAENGTYAGQSCEFGDTIYCIIDGDTANDNHWVVLQTNLEGAVIGPASSTTNGIPIFTGATGKAISDSGKTISTTAPNSNAEDSTIPTSKAVWSAISNYVKKSGDTMTGLLNIKPASGEGGEIHLSASTANTNQAGIILDQVNSTFRIFGIPSADGTTKTGTGTPLIIDPYAKTITGGYTLTGNLSGKATTAGVADSANAVAWANITEKPSSFTPASHTHYELATIGDQRNVATTPNTYSNKLIFQGLKSNTTIGNPSNDTYSYVIGLRGWSDSSGGDSHELAFNNSGINWRHGATTSWSAWTKLLDSSNYTNYTVTKTGTGASGTWGISISGNAATATTATNLSAKPSLAASGNNITVTTGGKTSDAFTVPYATNANSSYYPKFVSNNEIRFAIDTRPSAATDVYFGHAWSDGSKDAKINNYRFENGNSALAGIYAANFNGYTIQTSVPSNAVFTDTKNTAGSTDTSSKIFLIGATSQATNPQTYSDNQVYVTDGQLDANKIQIAEQVSLIFNATTNALDFVFA